MTWSLHISNFFGSNIVGAFLFQIQMEALVNEDARQKEDIAAVFFFYKSYNWMPRTNKKYKDKKQHSIQKFVFSNIEFVVMSVVYVIV